MANEGIGDEQGEEEATAEEASRELAYEEQEEVTAPQAVIETLLEEETLQFNNLTKKTHELNFTTSLDTSATDGKTILINTKSNAFAHTPREFHTLLNHESAHILFKTNRRSENKIEQGIHKKYPNMTSEIIHTIYNLTEDTRIEPLWEKLYTGTHDDWVHKNKEALVSAKEAKEAGQFKQNPISILYAARLGDKGKILIEGKENEEMFEQFRTELRKLKDKDFKASIPVTINVGNIIGEWYKQKQQKKDEGKGKKDEKAPKQKQGEGQGSGQGNGSEGEGEKQSPVTDQAEGESGGGESKEGSGGGKGKGKEKKQTKQEQEEQARQEQQGEMQKDVGDTLNNDKLLEDEVKRGAYVDHEELTSKDEDNIDESDKKSEKQILKESEEDLNEKLQSLIEQAKKRKPIDYSQRRGGGFIGGLGSGIVKREGQYVEIGSQRSMKIEAVLDEISMKQRERRRYDGSQLDMPSVIQKVANPELDIPLYREKRKEGGVEFWIYLDVSGSMSGEKLENAKRTLATLYDSAENNPNIKFRLKSFSDHIYDIDRKKLSSLDVQGGTSTVAALDDALSMLKKENEKKKIVTIMITDGGAGDDSASARNTGFGKISYPTVYDKIWDIRKQGASFFTLFIEPHKYNIDAVKTSYMSSDKDFYIPTMAKARPILETIVAGEIARRLNAR